MSSQSAELKIDPVHVTPLNDEREHIKNRYCWCKPHVVSKLGSDDLIIHNALDGREWQESFDKLALN